MDKKSVIITMKIIVYVLHTVWWEQEHKNPREIKKKSVVNFKRTRKKRPAHVHYMYIYFDWVLLELQSHISAQSVYSKPKLSCVLDTAISNLWMKKMAKCNEKMRENKINHERRKRDIGGGGGK